MTRPVKTVPAATAVTDFRITFEITMTGHDNIPERSGVVGAWYYVFSPRSASVTLDAVGLPVEVEVTGPRATSRGRASFVTDPGRAYFRRGDDPTGWGDFADMAKLPGPVLVAVKTAQARFEQVFPGVRS